MQGLATKAALEIAENGGEQEALDQVQCGKCGYPNFYEWTCPKDATINWQEWFQMINYKCTIVAPGEGGITKVAGVTVEGWGYHSKITDVQWDEFGPPIAGAEIGMICDGLGDGSAELPFLVECEVCELIDDVLGCSAMGVASHSRKEQ